MHLRINSLVSEFLITLINTLKKIKNATQINLTDHGQGAEQERSCHSCVCIAMSGRELASIYMSHTHNCGNLSPFFPKKSYPWSVKLILKTLWVMNFAIFGLVRPYMQGDGGKNQNLDMQQHAHIFFKFLGPPFNELVIG